MASFGTLLGACLTKFTQAVPSTAVAASVEDDIIIFNAIFSVLELIIIIIGIKTSVILFSAAAAAVDQVCGVGGGRSFYGPMGNSWAPGD